MPYPNRTLMQLTYLLSAILITAARLDAEPPPNVVMIVSDDQAWTDYGFMGHPHVHSPHLDKFANESATFTRGYVPSSLCRPSLVTMITGLYPHDHKVSGNDPPKGMDRGAMLAHIRRLPTIPKQLGNQGYVSLQTGKWWEGNFAEGGFTHGMTHGDPRRKGRHGDEGLAIGREGLAPIAEFLDGPAAKKPFFVWYAPMMPHTPHTPPERLLAKYRRDDRPLTIAKYLAMCEWFDETIGELLGLLEQRGLRQKTLIVFTADNGWIQDPNANGYAPRSKRSPYDGGLRTPILVNWPGHVQHGRYDVPVSTIDLAPTILAACDASPTSPLPGVDLVALANRLSTGGPSAASEANQRPLFGEIFEHDVADIDRPAKSLLYRWTLADGRWKLIQPADPNQPAEFYDVVADPTETRNLATDHAESVNRLRSNLDAWWNPAGR